MEQRPLHKDVGVAGITDDYERSTRTGFSFEAGSPSGKTVRAGRCRETGCEQPFVFLWRKKGRPQLSIGIREHRTTALIGPSGCGKSHISARAEPNE